MGLSFEEFGGQVNALSPLSHSLAIPEKFFAVWQNAQTALGSVAAMRGCTWSEYSLLAGVKRHPLESHEPRLTVRTLYCNTMINVSDLASESF